MSTKNLARTIIEGGRARYNKFQRRHSNREERARVREFLGQARIDDEHGQAVPPPRREPVYQGFRDKLAPAERWLGKQVGRPWDEVYGDLKDRFDPRTTAGRHIVYDHMLTSIAPVHVAELGIRWPRIDFVIDEDGTLQPNPWVRRRRKPPRVPGIVARTRCEVAAFAVDRRVGERGVHLFWFDPTGYSWVEGRRVPSGRYRQGRRLTPSETEFWSTLAPDRKDEIRFELRQ